MTTNYKIIVQFDGTDYAGWQYQTARIATVQQQLMKALRIIARERVVVTGSSRTDAGVHSTGMTANFHLKVRIENRSMERALNSLLPADIRVADCQIVAKKFNARHDAQKKTYLYRIYTGQTPSPFITRFVAHVPYPLNRRAMKRALKYFRGEKNFSSFTSDDPRKNRIRSIDRIQLRRRGRELHILVEGRSFLRYMVRNIAGTLIDVGRGKIKPREIPGIFAEKDRRKAGQTAPAKGLTLVRVDY